MGNPLKWLLGGFSLDLTEQLSFYGAYHSNPVNQLIHVIFVPVLWFTMDVFLWYTGEICPIPRSVPWMSHVVGRSFIDGSFVFFAIYAAYYPVLDKRVGTACACFYYFLYRAVNPFVEHYGRQDAWKVALGLHILGWYMQIHPGHGIFEKRKPALVDSFFQSLVLAPLFVWYEVCFFFGYDKQYKQDLDAVIAKRIAQAKQEEISKETKSS